MEDWTISDDQRESSTSDRWVDSIWFRAFLFSALLLGIIFRFSGLGNKIYSHDEVYTTLYATGRVENDVINTLWDGTDKTPGEIRQFLLPGSDNDIGSVLVHHILYRPHQAPLFFILEHYWMRLFGYEPASARGLAALAGALSIPAMYWLARELFQSRRVGLVSMALLSVSPFHVLFAQDARPYSLWALITMASSTLLLRGMRTNEPRTWMLYALTLSLGLYSHQLFLLVIVAQGLVPAAAYVTTRTRGWRGFVSACLSAFSVYAPWLYFTITGWRVVAVQTEVLGMSTTFFRYLQRWLLTLSSPLIDLDFNSDTANLLPYALRGLMMAFLLYCLFFLLKQSDAQGKLFIPSVYIVTAGSLMVFDLLFGGIRSTTGRYFVPAGVATILVVSYFISSRLDLTGGKRHSHMRLAASLLIIAGVLSNLNILLTDTWWTKELSRVRPEFIEAINRDGTLLIVSGDHPTNLGDVLTIGWEADADIRIRLLEDPLDIDFSGAYQKVYWFPAGVDDLSNLQAAGQVELIEIIPNTLWQVSGSGW